MNARLLRPRANERRLGSLGRVAPDERSRGTRKVFYQRLARVSVEHTYYDHRGDRSPDFVARPTRATAELMRNLGLLFRREETGFSVLYDELTEDSLFQYLRRQYPRNSYPPSQRPCDEAQSPCYQERRDTVARGVWTRLSFVLALSDPYFVNFTQIPADTNPALENFYFSNQDAHQPRRSEPSSKDDLKKIEGIGPKIEGLLNAARIHTFAQLAAAPTADVQAVLDRAGPRYRIHDPATWARQAALAAGGRWGELEELQERLEGGRGTPPPAAPGFVGEPPPEDVLEDSGRVLLAPGGHVTGDELVKVVGVQLSVPFCDGAEQLWVRSISGEVVLCKPRCFCQRLLGEVPFDEIDCRCAVPCMTLADHCGDGKTVVLEQVPLSFALLPEDKYRLEQVDGQCQPVDCEAMPAEVLYTELYPMPLCFIDLLFTDPAARPSAEGGGDGAGSGGGIYPVRDLWRLGDTRVEEVDYVLRFVRRETWWRYYVVPRSPATRFEKLRIESRSGTIEFAGPCCVRLADGSRAYCFLSQQPLALHEKSRYHFRLRGRNRETGHQQTVVERLPVASNRQVLPETPETACVELEASLCQDQPEPDLCAELLAEICPAFETSGTSERPVFSDIYVYI